MILLGKIEGSWGLCPLQQRSPGSRKASKRCKQTTLQFPPAGRGETGDPRQSKVGARPSVRPCRFSRFFRKSWHRLSSGRVLNYDCWQLTLGNRIQRH
jgi:hypothetical protein